MNEDLRLCWDALNAKTPAHTQRWRYYDGDHPIAFTNPKLREVFQNAVVFSKNYCQVIVNATRDRMRISAWSYPQEQTQNAIRAIWDRSLRKNAAAAHLAALVTGEAYIVAWDTDTGSPMAYYHDPRMAHVLMDTEYPDIPRVGCKRWIAGDGTERKQRLNLYYTERIEHYESHLDPQTHQAFRLIGEFANPHGRIPVFRFRLSERVNTGELTRGVLSLQDAMNKLLNDLMVASEYASFPQRWGIGNWEPGPVSIGPGTMLQLPPSAQGEQQTIVGTFQAADPNAYLTPIDSLAHSIAMLSATPKHYFTGQAGDPSGEALRAMEAPLIAKVLLYQETLGDAWEDCMAFCARIAGLDVERERIEAVWEDPHTAQPQAQASARLTNVQAGMPLINLLRDEGWTADQLVELAKDREAWGAGPEPFMPPSRLNTDAANAISTATGGGTSAAVPVGVPKV